MATDKVTPHMKATRSSFHNTFGRSENSTSSSDSPRMMDTDACEPAFPPVSISMGMYAVNTT